MTKLPDDVYAMPVYSVEWPNPTFAEAFKKLDETIALGLLAKPDRSMLVASELILGSATYTAPNHAAVVGISPELARDINEHNERVARDVEAATWRQLCATSERLVAEVSAPSEYSPVATEEKPVVTFNVHSNALDHPDLAERFRGAFLSFLSEECAGAMRAEGESVAEFRERATGPTAPAPPSREDERRAIEYKDSWKGSARVGLDAYERARGMR